MVKAKKANFVLTLPLRPTEHQLSVLDTQFNVARQLYYLALGEALRRWNSVRHTAQYGKRIAHKAPGLFLTLLEQKLTVHGGVLIRINPRDAKASQYDHVAERLIKKTLAERWHVFEDGTRVQRDLYSAFLLAHLDETHTIDAARCQQEYPTFKELHDQEIQSLQGQLLPSSMGI